MYAVRVVAAESMQVVQPARVVQGCFRAGLARRSVRAVCACGVRVRAVEKQVVLSVRGYVA